MQQVLNGWQNGSSKHYLIFLFVQWADGCGKETISESGGLCFGSSVASARWQQFKKLVTGLRGIFNDVLCSADVAWSGKFFRGGGQDALNGCPVQRRRSTWALWRSEVSVVLFLAFLWCWVTRRGLKKHGLPGIWKLFPHILHWCRLGGARDYNAKTVIILQFLIQVTLHYWVTKRYVFDVYVHVLIHPFLQEGYLIWTVANSGVLTSCW